MTPTVDELAQLVRLIDGVFEGKPPPRVGGRFGQYLRQCSRGRLDVQQLLAREGLTTTVRGWARGTEIGAVTLHPLASLQGSVPNDLWGPVEHLPAVCESLGVVLDLTLWTTAVAANRAHVLLSSALTPLTLSGPYRWFAPSRLTPGEAGVEAASPTESWSKCRFLKATADDLSRPPHALEYVFDYRLGKPGLKVFRVFSVRMREGQFDVLPGLDASARPVAFCRPLDDRLARLSPRDVALVFAYLEPWCRRWRVIDVEETDPRGCLHHLLTWADFQAELRKATSLAAADLRALHAALAAEQIDVPSPHEVVVDLAPRALNSAARALVRWLRYRT